jgi:lipid-A-disaccharide synthase
LPNRWWDQGKPTEVLPALPIAMSKAIKIFVSAGEASGDLHGASLVRALFRQAPGVRISCLGGMHLQEAGATVLVNNRDVAVVGVAEVARHLKSLRHAWRTIDHYLTSHQPDLAIFIDFPDFNFLLARKARRLRCKIFYYISPQVWAWRRGRVRTLRRLVDRMAVILPFERDFYAKHGMKVYFVGHPLLDVLEVAPTRSDDCRRYRPAGAELLVGLLPGSRTSEVRVLLPILLRAAAQIKAALPAVSFVLPMAPTLAAGDLEKQLRAHGTVPVQLVCDDTWGVVRACDLVLTASGTVTLESAIMGTPMVIIYRVSKLSEAIGRLLIRTPFIGLPNLIAGRAISPELIQDAANPQSLADTAIGLLKNPRRLEQQRQELAAIRALLGQPGAAERAARSALELVGL